MFTRFSDEDQLFGQINLYGDYSPYSAPNSAYIELRTCRTPTETIFHERQRNPYKLKTRNFYQAFNFATTRLKIVHQIITIKCST